MAADEVLFVTEHEGCHFEIMEGSGEGFYVFKFLGNDRVPTHDYLQDDLSRAKSFALHYFGIPESAWIKPSDVMPSRLPKD